MPYRSHQQRRVPTTRETIGSEFARADGNVDVQGSYKKAVGSTPDVDIDANVVHRKVELCCGCYWPDIEVGGVCAECVTEGVTPNVCKNTDAATRCFVLRGAFAIQLTRVEGRCAIRHRQRPRQARGSGVSPGFVDTVLTRMSGGSHASSIVAE